MEVLIDRSSESAGSISLNKNPTFQSEILFLKVLTEGTANLYIYNGENLERFFYNVDGSKTEQLIFKSYFLAGKNGLDNYTEIAKNNAFRQQLWNNLKCSETKLSDAERVDYNTNDLQKYFEKYNLCRGDKPVERVKSVHKGSFHLKASVMMNSGKLNINTNPFRNFAFGNKANFAFGLEAEYILPFNQNKWSVFIEPSYNSYKNSGEKSRPNQPDPMETIEVNLEYIQLPIGVRHYSFVNSNAKIFLDFSVVNSYVSKNSEIKYESHDSFDFDNSLVYFGLGAGFNYKDFDLAYLYYTNMIFIGRSYIYYNSSLILRYKFL